jgi:ATP-dependent DNA ligase
MAVRHLAGLHRTWPCCRDRAVQKLASEEHLTSAFQDVARAAWEMLPAGLVTDGEVVRWNENRLDFEALQRRHSAAPLSTGRLVGAEPVSYIAFDLLAVVGRDLGDHPKKDTARTLVEPLVVEVPADTALSL